MKTINIADNDFEDYAEFYVTDFGDIIADGDVTDEDQIVATILDSPWYPGTEGEWLNSVAYRYHQLTQGV